MFRSRLNNILLAGLLLGAALAVTGAARAGDDAGSGETYIAEKNGARIVLSGVRHGTGMAAPSPAVRQYFERATVLMTEFDYTDQRRSAMSLMQFRRGEALAANKFLNEQELTLIHSAWTKKLGGKASMSAQTLGELHACGLGLYLLPSSPGSAPVGGPPMSSSWEKIFLAEAKQGSKPIVELEPRGAMRICAEMPREQVRDFVVGAAMLGLDEQARETYLRYSALSGPSFAGGDGAAGYAQTLQALASRNEYRSAFLAYMAIRNQTMAEVLAQQHAMLPSSGLGFAMAGSLHLHGEHGILALLREKGFVITRL